MERISIFNYEAFYLDYLEGSLSQEDTDLLFDFLENHPECRLEDEELITYISEAENMPKDLKINLKQVDETEAVNLSNLDHFLIAEAEQEINDEKLEELNLFIAANDLDLDRRLIAATYFDPNDHMVFAYKSDLKQDKRIVFWPYVAAAASIIILIFLTLPSNNSLDTDSAQQALVNKTDELDNADNNVVSNAPNSNDQAIGISDPNPKTQGVQQKEHKPRPQYTPRRADQLASQENVKLKHLPARQFLSPNVANDPEPLSQQLISSSEAEESVNLDYASAHFSGISNPIEPITKVLSNKTNREIDFRSGKSKTDNSKGFFVKIGKFEFSRKKH